MKKRLHMICNSHIDPIWQWNWDEGISSVVATFKSAADLCDEFDYIFCHGESLLYEALEKCDPALFERIRKLIKAGKWRITSGWYLQPDCNLPMGETFVRHIAVGKKYFMEKFGVEPKIATSYDAFGHSVGLVQIMAKNGYTGYLFCRPEKDVAFNYPSRFFNWVSPDGSSVVASWSLYYSSKLGKLINKVNSELYGEESPSLTFSKETDKPYILDDIDYILWGVGNHGGGPSRKDLHDLAALEIEDVEIIHSTPETLFSDNIKIGGDVTTSLVTSNPGCYSSMARVKQAFRKAENLFYGTEKMLAAAMLKGYKTDLKPVDSAEKNILLASFHDVLPGTCIEGGETEGLGMLAASDKTMRDYRTDALLYLTVGERVAGEGEFPIFVFNYEPREVKRLVEAEFSLATQNWDDEYTVYEPHIYDEDGNELVCQQIKEESNLNLDWRKKIIFDAVLKPLGITRFNVKTKLVDKREKKAKAADLEAELSAFDLVREPVTFELYDDTADPWGMSLDEIKTMGKNPKPLRLMTSEEATSFCHTEEELPPVHVIEDGDVYKGIEAFYASERTNVVLDYKLYKQQPYVDLKVTVEFAEKDKLLRVKIPLPENFRDGTAIGDGAYVWEEKPALNMNCQKWAGVKSGEEIFAVANDGAYGCKVEDGYISFTLLRGAGYCVHPIHTRKLYMEDRYIPRIDCGRYTFKFRIFKGGIYEVNEMAEILNLPPYAVNIFPTGSGEYPNERISVEGNVTLTALKPYADGTMTFRIYNPATCSEQFTVAVGEDKVSAIAGAREVVTVKYSDSVFTVYHDTMPM